MSGKDEAGVRFVQATYKSTLHSFFNQVLFEIQYLRIKN